MSFNVVQFDGAEFSVNAYTEAVEAEFAAEFSIDHYTSAVEAEFLQTFFDDDEDADESIDGDEVWGRKKEPRMGLNTSLAMYIKPIGIQDSFVILSEKKPTICLNETDTGNSDLYFKCR